AEGREASLPLALECLAWCQAAGALAPVVGPTAFLELLERLCAINEDAAGIDWQRHPAVHQMLAGELAVALGYHFANLDSLRQRAAAGRKTLAGGILELLDGEGLPQAEHLP